MVDWTRYTGLKAPVGRQRLAAVARSAGQPQLRAPDFSLASALARALTPDTRSGARMARKLEGAFGVTPIGGADALLQASQEDARSLKTTGRRRERGALEELGLAADLTDFLPGGGGAGDLAMFLGAKFASNIPGSAEALENAKTLAAQRAPRSAIWQRTGWAVDKDGKWYTEVDDSAAKLGGGDVEAFTKRLYDPKPLKLDEALDHPELFKAAPELAKVAVKPLLRRPGDGYDDVVAYYDLMENAIYMNMGHEAAKRDPFGTLLHEVQHSAQTMSGLDGGTSVVAARANPMFGELYMRARDLGMEGEDAEMFARKASYLARQGEVQARNTAEHRFGLDLAERRRNHPEATQDAHPSNVWTGLMALNTRSPDRAAFSFDLGPDGVDDFTRRTKAPTDPEVARAVEQGRTGQAAAPPRQDPAVWRLVGRDRQAEVNRALDRIDKSGKLAGVAAHSSVEGRDAIARLDRQVRRQALAKLGAMPGGPRPGRKLKAAEVERLSDEYLRLAGEGAQGRDWYADSGEAVLERFGGREDDAVKFNEALAITSANTPVRPNAGFANKGLNQYLTGRPVRTGQYPERMGENLGLVFDQDRLRAGTGARGRKVTAFGENLSADYPTQGIGSGRAVHDMWDGMARGYEKPREGFSPRHHAWMDAQDGILIDDANDMRLGGMRGWDHRRLQAAAWVGKRYEALRDAGKSHEQAMRQATESYADALKAYDAQHSWESLPGKTTGHLPELFDMPWEGRAEYHERQKDIFLDEFGRSRTGDMLGMNVAPSIDGPGVFEGGINPGTQDLLGVGTQLYGAEGYGADPASRELMNTVAASQGLLGAQDAGAWSFMSGTPTSAAKAGAATINLGRPLSNDEAESLIRALGERYDVGGLGLMPSRDGVMVRNFGGAPDLRAVVEDARQVLGVDKGAVRYAGADGGYIGNDWSEQRFGEGYFETLEANPQLLERWEAGIGGIAEKLNELDREMASAGNMTLSPYIMAVRDALAEGGLAALKRLAASGALPAAAAAVILPVVFDDAEPAA